MRLTRREALRQMAALAGIPTLKAAVGPTIPPVRARAAPATDHPRRTGDAPMANAPYLPDVTISWKYESEGVHIYI